MGRRVVTRRPFIRDVVAVYDAASDRIALSAVIDDQEQGVMHDLTLRIELGLAYRALGELGDAVVAAEFAAEAE